MKYTLEDFNRLEQFRLQYGMPIQKAAPVPVAPEVISQRAYNIVQLGLLMVQQGQFSYNPSMAGQKWLDSFKTEVKKAVSDLPDVTPFMQAVEFNLYMDVGNSYLKNTLLARVQEVVNSM